MQTDQLRAAAEQIVEHHKTAVAADSYCEGALKLAKAWLAEHPADAPGGAELPSECPKCHRKHYVSDLRSRSWTCLWKDCLHTEPATNATESTDLLAEVERLREQVRDLQAKHYEQPWTVNEAAQLRTQLAAVERERDEANALLQALCDEDMPNDLVGAVNYLIDHSNEGWMRAVNAERERAEARKEAAWWKHTYEAVLTQAPLADQNRRLREALKPFAKFACSPPGECQCHNCVARDALEAKGAADA